MDKVIQGQQVVMFTSADLARVKETAIRMAANDPIPHLVAGELQAYCWTTAVVRVLNEKGMALDLGLKKS